MAYRYGSPAALKAHGGCAFLLCLFCLRAAFAQPIIADHLIVDDYAASPQQYIDEVKKMWINIPGESHSRGYLYALDLLLCQGLVDSTFWAESGHFSPPKCELFAVRRIRPGAA